MKGIRYSLIVLWILASLSQQGVQGSVGDRGVDKTPPEVTLLAPEEAPYSFDVHVEAWDRKGIARVLVSVEGVVQGVRLRPPFDFTLTASALPAEVCASAVDTSGNSSIDCAIVQSPPTCEENLDCEEDEFCLSRQGLCSEEGICTSKPGPCPRTEITDRVCGCDGAEYPSECVAHQEGVSVRSQGHCPGPEPLATFMLDVTPRSLFSCNDHLTLTATVLSIRGNPVADVVVIFDEGPSSDILGTFLPASQVMTDSAGRAVTTWTPFAALCVAECMAATADPNSGADGDCDLFFTASDVTGAFTSVQQQVTDNIP